MRWEHRHSMLAVLFCAYLLCYMDRMVMASAIPFIAEEFHLSPLAMGGVLSAFFSGYAVMQIPGGLLADRFGLRRVMTISILGWSAFTALTGMASSLPLLFGIRVLFGLSEGVFPPAATKAVALWFAPAQAGRANGLQLAAVNLGAALAPIFVAPLIVHLGWRAVFYSLLVPGLLLALAVWRIIRNPPETSDARRVIAPARIAPPIASSNRCIAVLKVPAVRWCALALFFANMVTWGLMNWLPTYLLRARGFGTTKMGIAASLPYLAGAAGYYLGGYLSDRFFAQRRRVPIIAGLMVGAGMTYAAAVAPSGEWATAALVLAFLGLFAASAGLFTLPMLIVPRGQVGVAFGVVNTFGQAAAFLSPLLVGYTLGTNGGRFDEVLFGFVALFLIAAGVASKDPAAASSIVSNICLN